MKPFLTLLLCLNSLFFFAQDDILFDTKFIIDSFEEDQTRITFKDGESNLYYAGWFKGKVDFDPKSTVFKMKSGVYRNAYIVKLDSNKNFIWAKQLKANSAQGATINDLIVDKDENVYLSGYWSSSVDFDPGPGVKNYISEPGAYRTFIMKLDQNGEFDWLRFIQSSVDPKDQCYTNQMELGDKLNVYLTVGLPKGAIASNGIGDTISEDILIKGPFNYSNNKLKIFLITYNQEGTLTDFKDFYICTYSTEDDMPAGKVD